MSFKKDVLMSELNIMMDKEREMRDFYNRLLEKIEHPTVHDRIRSIRDDEERHMGYVKIIIEMFSEEIPTNEDVPKGS